MISPVLHELLKMNPPFELLIQAAYMQANLEDKDKLMKHFANVLKEIK